MDEQGASMDVAGWLRSLSLERYEAAFRENDISERVLPRLTLEDLKEMPLFLSAIAGSSWMRFGIGGCGIAAAS